MDMEMPNVVTTHKIKGTEFVLRFRAYRKLTASEMQHALGMWQTKKKVKKIPYKGSVEIITIHGFDD